MSKTSPPKDGLTVVVPVTNAAGRAEKALAAWAAALDKLDRPHEIIAVDDGSSDGTAAVLEKMAGRVSHLRVLKHDAPRGFGACLRTALAEAKHPLLLTASLDYPYTPSDARRLLERIDVRDEVFGRQPDLISGGRSGPVPPALCVWVGRAWRLFARVAAGMQLEPRKTWLGCDFAFNKCVGVLFGNPLGDVSSAFKLYRTDFLKRFPIQSDGDFVHTELVAKATFLTSIMDEVPLTPKPDAAPAGASVRREMWHVFKHPEFAFPPPPAPAPEPVPVAAAP